MVEFAVHYVTRISSIRSKKFSDFYTLEIVVESDTGKHAIVLFTFQPGPIELPPVTAEVIGANEKARWMRSLSSLR